jgi:hypothetical protein
VTLLETPDDAVLVPPAYLWIPDRRGSYGDEAIGMAEAAGLSIDPEQRLTIDAMLSYGAGGLPVALETCRIEARQNGKTKRELLPVYLFDLFTGKPDDLIWTAHLFQTARDAFNDFVSIIENADFLRKRVRKVYFASGAESVHLLNGSVLKFLARSSKGGRGLGGRRLAFDEALVLSDEAMGALIPTLSARKGAQINYASSAGSASSNQLRRLVLRGRAAARGERPDPSLIYIEHCAPGSWDDPPCRLGKVCTHATTQPGCALDREDLWLQANHAMARNRMGADQIQAERRALPPIEFGRERLGWHESPEGEDPDRITAEQWGALADPSSAIAEDNPVVFAVDCSPGGAMSAIAVAGRRPDGLIHVGVIEHGRGTEWVPNRLEELAQKWDQLIGTVWKPSDPIGALAEKIRLKGLWMTEINAQEMGQACGLFKQEVDDRGLRHSGGTVLDDALTVAERRVGVEGVWNWGRRVSTGDICAIVAATEAVWGLISAGDGDPQVLVF